MYCYNCGKFDEHKSNFCRNCAAPMITADGKLKEINPNLQAENRKLGKEDLNRKEVHKDYTIVMDKLEGVEDTRVTKEKDKGGSFVELINKLRQNYKKEVIIGLSLVVTIILVFTGIKLIDSSGGKEVLATSTDENSPSNKEEKALKIKNGGPDGYVLENSHEEKLSKDEVEELELCFLMIARNEIYARHGYIFKNKQLQRYFESKDWYSKDRSFKGSIKSQIEQQNIQLIKEIENQKNRDLADEGKKLTAEEALETLLKKTDLKLKDELDLNKQKTHKYFDESFYKYPSKYFSGQKEKVNYLVSQSSGKVYIYTEDGDFYLYK
ncbi:MAG TPA: hypothetical protein DGK91_12695 [Clostridium sp.]|jgi:hypothetical protein|nr:YARHG domain-containing protein [Clostridia bacterium]HCW05290.1 hypothetical protein [Clostridium sp.]